MFTGHEINKVRKYIIKSVILGRYKTLELLSLLDIVSKDHNLKKNRERQRRYREKKAILENERKRKIRKANQRPAGRCA